MPSSTLSTAPILDSLWRASEMGMPASFTTPSGHAGLDAELPGGGWPAGQLSEVLQAQAGRHEWRLLLPALRSAAASGTVVLIGCPHWPNMATLAGQGIAPARVLLVEAERPADRLWAAEQALRCRELAALLVWLPQARAEQLRRLQFASQAAHQARPPLAFVFRPLSAQQEASPAPLRLGLRLGGQVMGTALPGLAIDIFKRRGPQLTAPLQIHTAMPPVLALLSPRESARLAAMPSAVAVPVPDKAANNVITLPTPFNGPLHAVDRPVATDTSIDLPVAASA